MNRLCCYRAWQKRSIFFFTPAVLFGILLQTALAQATTYFVDTTGGNDTYSGLSQASAWKTVPGCRKSDNSAFLRTAWGSISSSTKLAPGDIVEVKAGSSFGSALCGRLLIDATYYQNGSAQSPIVVRVSSSWGSGHVTWDGSGVTVPQFNGYIHVTQRNFIHLKGVDASRRWVVRNGGGQANIFYGGSSSAHALGLELHWAELYNANLFGFNISYSDNFLVSNTIAHDNGSSDGAGFVVGDLSDARCDNGEFRDCEAYRNGLNSTNAYGISHGFQETGAVNLRHVRCKSHDNHRDGFDAGTVTNTNDTSATYIGCESYNNGEDGFGVNGGPQGTQTFRYINTIAYGNANGWQIYEGAIVEIDHSIAAFNGGAGNFGGNILTYSEFAPPASVTLRNFIGYKPRGSSFQIGGYRSALKPTVLDIRNSIFVPRSANTEAAFEYPYGTSYSYATPPSVLTSSGTNKIGITFDTPPLFTQVSSTNYAGNNFSPASSGSTSVNAGTFLATPAEALLDSAGMTRSNPPEVGAFEFIQNPGATPSPPTNVRIAQ